MNQWMHIKRCVLLRQPYWFTFDVHVFHFENVQLTHIVSKNMKLVELNAILNP
jgi:hypothetical protein